MPLFGSSSSKRTSRSPAPKPAERSDTMPKLSRQRSSSVPSLPSDHPDRSETPIRQSFDTKDGSDPWQGHLGHLTKLQEDNFEKFKKTCAKEGLYIPATDNKKASHDDLTMLRFLRARKFDITGALNQFRDTEVWRAENKIDELYDNIDIDEYNQARTVYPQWTGRRDKRGIPVYVQVVSAVSDDAMSKFTKNSKSITKIANSDSSGSKKSGIQRRATVTGYKGGASTGAAQKSPPHRLMKLFALYENLTQFVIPLCNKIEDRPDPERPVSGTVNIADISGVGLIKFWNLKQHLQDASVLATAHYPETLDRVFVVGAPSFFPTVWGWLKRWFDPVTTAKFVIVPQGQVNSTLARYIDLEDLPKMYGGNLDWDVNMVPNLGEKERKAYGDGEWLTGPVRFTDNGLVPVGTVDGARRGLNNLERNGMQNDGAQELSTIPSNKVSVSNGQS